MKLAWGYAHADTPRGLVLWGDFGTGKTGLAALALFARAIRGERCAAIDWRDFAGAVQDTYSADSGPSRRDLVQRVGAISHLLIDELRSDGATETPDRTGILDELLRYRHARELPLIVTTNLAPKALMETFRQYAAERLGESCDFVQVTGASLRFAS